MRDGTSRCPTHPEKVWAKSPTATKRVTGRRLQALRAQLFDACPLCVECQRLGRVRAATQRDHIKPLADGGVDDESNVQGLCDECHDIKSKLESAEGRRGSRW